MEKIDKKLYKKRLIDEKLELYLTVFGAVNIKGPKWCGKTWTGLFHSKSVTYMTLKENKDLAKENPKNIFTNTYPQLIDEWQIVPSIWDSVRHECDKDHIKGKFILTGSTSLTKEEKEEEIFHTGTGRIVDFNMYPMSLYESGYSNGEASITDMLNNKQESHFIRDINIKEIVNLIIRGGWPENLSIEESKINIIPKAYLESILNKDLNERKDRKRDSKKMRMLIKSLSRNESTIVNNSTILRDVEEITTEEERIESKITLEDYISVLDDLYLTLYQPAYSINYRSSKRIGKSPKRHFIDPSLACASLGLNQEKLLNDFNTLGFMFESLVTRDLKIYMEYLEGDLYHFRDNISGDEVDAILEFSDGSYAAVEIKLSHNSVEEAKKSLLKFYQNVKKKPKFMCVIVGTYSAITQDKDGIYVVPITALKP